MSPALDKEKVSRVAAGLGVTIMEARLLLSLRVAPTIRTVAEINRAMHDGSPCEAGIVKVLVHHVRAKLGRDVITNFRARGYALSPEAVARLRQKLGVAA